MTFVLDASLTLNWLFEDESTPDATAVFALAQATRVDVPAYWATEVASGAVKSERRRRATAANVDAFFAYLTTLDIAVHAASPAGIWADVLPLARRHRLSVYDAGYLDLAMRLGLPLATADKSLRRAAAASGVSTMATDMASG